MALKPNPNWRGDPTFLPEVLKAFGVNFRELPGWLTWGMGDFNIIQGVIWHHTGARNTSAEYIARNAGLSGALSSQFHTAPEGLQTLCGVGIAWHAGRGSYAGWPTNNANSVSIGFEMQHNGTDAWPEAQLESTRRATAAILWFLGKRATTATMLSHWEYSWEAQKKWDPGKGNGVSGAMMDMNSEREKVNKLIDSFNNNGALIEVPSNTNSSEDTGMLFKQITDFIKGYLGPQIDALQEVWRQLRGPNGNGWAQLGQNAKGQNLSLVDAIAASRHDIAGLRETLAELTAKVDQLIKDGK